MPEGTSDGRSPCELEQWSPDEGAAEKVGGGDAAEAPLTLLGCLGILCAVVLPSATLIVCFSALGYGPEMVSAVPAAYGMAGDLALVLAALQVVILYTVDAPRWNYCARRASLVMPWAFVVAGLVLKVTHYPSYLMGATSLHVIIFLGILRGTSCKGVRRRRFYTVVACVACLCAVVCAGVWLRWWADGNDWSEDTRTRLAGRAARLYKTVYQPSARFDARPLNYTTDCGQGRDVSAFSSEEQSEIADACALAATVLYVMWACPLIITVGGLTLILFISIIGLNMRLETDGEAERLLKIWLIALILVGMSNYASASYFSAVSLRLGSTLLTFSAVAFISVVMWFCLEQHGDVAGFAPRLAQMQASTKFVRFIPPWVWNVVRGMIVGGLNVLIPLFLLADMARRRASGRRGAAGGDRRFTWWGQKLMGWLQTLRWANTLWWVCTLGHAYFIWQVGVSKATYIFFSWLNSQLSTMPFAQVLVINVLVGVAMFLLPPVPGVAVYIFTGIVVAEQGRQNPSIGFVYGCAIAVVLAFVLKLIACCAQYALGYFMGKSVKVQALVGVDKPFTRAMEVILKERGLSVKKVSILVGGPDWPVSVGCGILGVSVPQMVLGTAPVLGVVAPCVRAGAFQARAGPGEGDLFSTGAALLTSLSVLIQLGTALAAVISVMNVVGDRGEELARPREEHRAVEALAREEEQYRRAFQEATEWGNLPCVDRAILCLAAGLSVVSGAIFAFYGSSCFENFSISSDIDDPLDENGLGGDVRNIVILPLGAVPLALYAASAVLHLVYVLETSRLASLRLRGGRPLGGAPAVVPVEEAPAVVIGRPS